jgi:pentatricopeptide repeat protein
LPGDATEKCTEFETGLVQAGYDTKELPVPLAATLIVLRSQSGKTLVDSSYRWPLFNDIATFIRKTMPETMDTEKLNELRRNETLDRIDLPRLSNLLKHAVNHGEGEKLSGLWKEYKSRLLDSNQDEKAQSEIFTKILSACLRCERRYRTTILPETIQDIMSHVPTPMPTNVFNVILAERANLDQGQLDEQEIGLSDYARSSVQTSQIGSLWRTATKQGTVKDVRSYMIYMEGLGRAGDLERLQLTWKELVEDKMAKEAHQDSQWPPMKAFNLMLSSALIVRSTGPPYALDQFERACQPGSTTPVNIITINTILRHHARMSNVPAMTSLFSFASQLKLKPDVITYTTLVQGLLRAGQVEMARSVLAQMSAQGLEPNEQLCSMLIADLSKFGSQTGLRSAEEMLARMKRTNMKITIQAWTSLISGYFRGGWDKDAWSTIERMERYGIRANRVAYNIILREGGNIRDETMGESWPFKVFKRMTTDGVVPNGDTYFILLEHLVAKGRWGEADLVLREMQRHKFRPTTGALTALIRRIHARR